MNYLRLPLRLDVHNTFKKIEGIKEESDLFDYSRVLRGYQESGLLKVPREVKDKLSDQLFIIRSTI